VLGLKSKLLFITWVPDAITRPSLKEIARVKTMGVMWTGKLKKIFTAVVCNVQANDLSDVEWMNLLSKASKYEKDPVDPTWRPAQDL